MKPISGKKLCRLLEKAGWSLQCVRGSHHIFSKTGERKIITVPVHGKKMVGPGLAKDVNLEW